MGTVYKRGKMWWIKYRENGKDLYESSKSKKKTVAVELLKKREGEIQGGGISGVHFDRVTFDELSEDFIWDRKMNTKDVEDAEMRVRFLEKHFKGMKITRLTDKHIRTYIETRKGEGAANATVNRELSALKRMINLGARKTPPKVDRNQVPYITKLKEDNTRKGFFEHAEYLALMKHLPEYLKPFCEFAYKTGWRKGEIKTLKWKNIDLEEGCARLEPGTTKNDSGRTVYFDEDLKATLQTLWDNRKSNGSINPYVFIGHDGKGHVQDPRKAWQNACKDAGIGNKLFHDFRRTAVRNMVRAGISEHTAMKISGHKTRSVFDRYDIVSDNDLKEAAKKQASYVFSGSVTKIVTISDHQEKRNVEGR